MSKKEERLVIIGLIIALLGCIAGWLAIPQIQNIIPKDKNLSLNGKWKGVSSEGGTISFDVNGNDISNIYTDITLRNDTPDSLCPTQGSVAVWDSKINENTFHQEMQVTFGNFTLDGIFQTDQTANGTITPLIKSSDTYKCHIINVTWTATKQK